MFVQTDRQQRQSLTDCVSSDSNSNPHWSYTNTVPHRTWSKAYGHIGITSLWRMAASVSGDISCVNCTYVLIQ